jgi:hypothetical protein
MLSLSLAGCALRSAPRHGVGPRSIHSRCRLAYLVAARHELIWLIRQSTTWSTTQIGRYMSMNHSSILHAIKKHEQRRASNVSRRWEDLISRAIEIAGISIFAALVGVGAMLFLDFMIRG